MPKVNARVRAQSTFALLLAAFSILLAGCASNPPAPAPPRIGHGAEEYLQLTTDSQASVRDALHWLDRLAAQTNHCPPKLVAGFSHEVDKLQVESIRVRSRAQAIQARGDAYFEAWSEDLASLKGPQAQKAAEYLPQMHDAFLKIKLASQHSGEAFRPFFSGLRRLRAQIETDPAVVQTDDTSQLIRSTRGHGSQVMQTLGTLAEELQAAIPLLTRAKAEAHL